MSKKNKKNREWKYSKELVGAFTDNDLKTLEKLAKTVRTKPAKFYKDLRRICEFTVNQLDYRPGTYLVQYLFRHKTYRDCITKTYTTFINTKWWKVFCNKFGAYVLGYCVPEFKYAGTDFKDTVRAAYDERHL